MEETGAVTRKRGVGQAQTTDVHYTAHVEYADDKNQGKGMPRRFSTL